MQTQLERQLGNHLLQRAGFAAKVLDLIGGRCARGVARQAEVVDLKELL